MANRCGLEFLSHFTTQYQVRNGERCGLVYLSHESLRFSVFIGHHVLIFKTQCVYLLKSQD